jgi:hypothetical protein
MRTLLASILLAAAVLGTSACGGAGAGKIMADTPIVEYLAPDVDELAGIEEPEEPEEEEDAEEGTEPAPAPAAK